ncbi:MAG: ATP-dependent helicase [Fusobacteriota bacterium]
MGILNDLNERQKKAVLQTDGPLLILAGAGSGKTRTLTYRIAYMIKEKGISPYNILAMTFTNKAAKEMKDRVIQLAGEEGKKVLISTFHSFGVRLIRMYGEKIGYSSNFNIYDVSEQKKIMSQIIKKLKINVKELTPKKAVAIISKLKEDGMLPEEYEKTAYTPFTKAISEIYHEYPKELKKNNAMDFADLLLYTDELLNIKEIKDKIQDQYKYIMVDEYQDTNRIQYSIIHNIAEKNKNLCVVGDEDQSIYGFRGADIRNILNFESDYKNATTIKLEQNYRSTQIILDTANKLIENNESSKGKKLWTDLEEGEKIEVYEAIKAEDEAKYIKDKIIELTSLKGYSYKDITILYRTNSQSRNFEEFFIRDQVPYKIYGGTQFYQRKEIKDVIAYLKIVNNTRDEISLRRIINTPKRGIGKKTISKIEKQMENLNVPFFYILKNAKEISGLSSRVSNILYELYEVFDELIELTKEATTSKVLDKLLERVDFQKRYEEIDELDRIENIQELRNSILQQEKNEEFISLADYLENAALEPVGKVVEEDNHVKLMTIHRAKGLEFPIVFLTGLEDDLFPGKKVMNNEDELEEERRLCYVAITRAEKQLFLSYAKSRMKYGELTFNRRPSRFLQDMPKKNLNSPKMKLRTNGYKQSTIKNMDDLKRKMRKRKKKKNKINSDYNIGQYVKHKAFGEGKIKNIEVGKLLISFPGYGEKKFKTSIAKKFLEKV